VRVFTTDDDQLRWEYDGDLPDTHLPAVTIFDGLLADIKVYLPRRYRQNALQRLGKALYAALDDADASHHSGRFEGIRQFVLNTALQNARALYVVSVTLTAIVAATATALLTMIDIADLARLTLTGAAAGAVGATISVLFRSSSIQIEPGSGREHVIFQGAARAILGTLFGAFAILAVRANLVAGVLRGNLEASLLFATAAGFSERIVPELIKRFEAGDSNSGRG
jgi:hypothetical protein